MFAGLGICTCTRRAQREEHVTCCGAHVDRGQTKGRILERGRKKGYLI